VLHPYDLNAMCDGAHGAPLVPWPNRLADGRHSFDGEEHQVALTEPEKRNAIHGFLRWRNWTALIHEPSRVVMATRLHPLQGWPHTLDVSVEYLLDEDGLTSEIGAMNIGERPCPFGRSASVALALEPLDPDCKATLTQLKLGRVVTAKVARWWSARSISHTCTTPTSPTSGLRSRAVSGSCR
jgi:aldose 1-epimerase